MTGATPTAWEKSSVAISAMALIVSIGAAGWTVRSQMQSEDQAEKSSAWVVAALTASSLDPDDSEAERRTREWVDAQDARAGEKRYVLGLLRIENRGSRPIDQVAIYASGVDFAQGAQPVAPCSVRYMPILAPTDAATWPDPAGTLVVGFRDFNGRRWTRVDLAEPKPVPGEDMIFAVQEAVNDAGIQPADVVEGWINEYDLQFPLKSEGC